MSSGSGANKPTEFDVMIIGGGPAGMSASLWCAELGLTSVILEKEPELGGQLLWTFNPIVNHLGIEAANGRELRDRFWHHIAGRTSHHMTGAEVVETDLIKREIVLASGVAVRGKTVVIATGVRRRKLDVPGENEFVGRGILSSGVKARGHVAGKRVLIVGGGDGALENALLLSKSAAQTFLVHRRDAFTARREFTDRLDRSSSIEILRHHVVTEIKGTDNVDSVILQDTSTGSFRDVAVDRVLIRVGIVPNTEMFVGQIRLDGPGFIIVDASFATSIENIYAIGDVCSPDILTISNAVGQGMAVVKVIYNKLKRDLRQDS